MLGLRLPYRHKTQDDAEKPFWISFSDMMTALMVLFLVVMTVTLLAVTHTISQAERMKTQRDAEISKLMAKIREASRDFPGITLKGNTIDFGDQARFDTDSNRLTREQAQHLRAFVPSVLKIARDPLGKKWLKRVVVEGYADQRGTYLHNLDLSMQRSERVLCALLAMPEPQEKSLNPARPPAYTAAFPGGRGIVQFFEKNPEESRRIELKLEFLEMGETRPITPPIQLAADQYCPLD
ncbi:MAG: OmpA family protein [Desulfomicrobium escambiense]|nr:OmpA family protein [Desulfomicrobium escambiense]